MQQTILAVIFVALSLIQPEASGAERSREQQFLNWMEGEWTFSLGKYQGKRTIRILYSDHLAAFEEIFDGQNIRAEGYIGYSPIQNVFYEFSVHNSPGEFAFMAGSLDQEKDIIVYRPQSAGSDDSYEVKWMKTSSDSFSYTAFDIGADGVRTPRWTAEFTRKHTGKDTETKIGDALE